MDMNYPGFFDTVLRIALRDPLGAFLGTFAGGVVEYGYFDAVKLAGHSCPTAAGAYLMTAKALGALCADALPERGAIRVEFRDDLEAGVTGVIANVVSQITGATQRTGSKASPAASTGAVCSSSTRRLPARSGSRGPTPAPPSMWPTTPRPSRPTRRYSRCSSARARSRQARRRRTRPNSHGFGRTGCGGSSSSTGTASCAWRPCRPPERGEGDGNVPGHARPRAHARGLRPDSRGEARGLLGFGGDGASRRSVAHAERHLHLGVPAGRGALLAQAGGRDAH